MIEFEVAPLLHNIVPPGGIDKVELPQLFTTDTIGAVHRVALTVTGFEASVTVQPLASVPVAVAMFVTEPAFRSAWVTV